MALLELNGGSAAWLNGLGIALIAARVAHPLGLRADKVNSPLRTRRRRDRRRHDGHRGVVADEGALSGAITKRAR